MTWTRTPGSRSQWEASGRRSIRSHGRGALGVVIALVGCAGDPYADPDGVQISLFGDRMCSDPVYGQIATQCCMEHVNCFAFGGTEENFHACNDEFLGCMLRWGVPRDAALARWLAVEQFGRDSFRWSAHPTR